MSEEGESLYSRNCSVIVTAGGTICLSVITVRVEVK